MTRPRVFVTQDEERFNLDKLDEFGKRITIFTRSTYPDEVDERMRFMAERARNIFLRYEYRPDIDYVAIVGDMLGVAVCFMMLGRLGYHRVVALKYDGKEQAYYPATIQLI